MTKLIGETSPHRRVLRLRGREIPVVLPRRHDPRLHLTVVIIALQVLGQTVLGFKISIAQILVSVVAGGLIEGVTTLRRDGVLAWPASGLQTGNSVAFILRASGTRHGDWWSLHGVQYFLLAVVLSLVAKHLIRPGGRHLFNPSNIGLVWTLLVIGPGRVFPQYLWWGKTGVPVILALVVIIGGAAWILPQVRMVGMATAFVVTFSVLVGLFALAGHSFIAIWREGPIEGWSYWLNICLSPEIMVFTFFMISDPQTAPKSQSGRVIYGAGTAAVAAALLFFQPTEFGIKLAVLSSLTVMCALVPRIDAVTSRRSPAHPVPARRSTAAVTAAVLIITVAAVVNTAALVNDRQLINIERGVSGPLTAQ